MAMMAMVPVVMAMIFPLMVDVKFFMNMAKRDSGFIGVSSGGLWGRCSGIYGKYDTFREKCQQGTGRKGANCAGT